MSVISKKIAPQDYSNYIKSSEFYKAAKKSVTEKYNWVDRLDKWAGADLVKRTCAAVAYLFAAAHDYVKRDTIQSHIYRETARAHQDVSQTPNAEWQQAFYNSCNDWEKAATASALVTNLSHTYLEEEACKEIQTKYGLKNVVLTPNFGHVDNNKSVNDEVTTLTRSYTIKVKDENGILVPLGTLRLGAQFDHGYQTGTLTFDCFNWNATELSKAQKVSDSFSLTNISGETVRKQSGGRMPSKQTVLSDMAKSCIESRFKIECAIGSIRYEKSREEESGETYDLDFTKYRDFSCDILDPNTQEKIGTLTAKSTFIYDPTVYTPIPAEAEVPLEQLSYVGGEEERVAIMPGSEKLDSVSVDFEVTFDKRTDLNQLQRGSQEKRTQLIYDAIGF